MAFWRSRILPGLLAGAALLMGNALKAETMAYHMPADGQLTLGLYDRQGALLRWLVQDDFRRAGDHSESWDGRDQWGRTVPAGDYVVRGVYHAPLSTEYLMSIANPGQPPWPTADGRGDWLSDEAPAQAVVSDGSWVFIGAPNSEKGFTLMALDATGQRRWGTKEPRHNYARSTALALDGNFLYALYSGPERPNADASPYRGKDAVGRALLRCVDKRTGDPARFSRGDDPLRIATWPYHDTPVWLWNLRNNQSFAPAVYEGQPRYACLDVGEATNAVGIAAAGKKLYVSFLQDNKLREFDESSGEATGREFAVPAPVGLCRFDDRTLLAVSGMDVLKVDLATGKSTPLVTSNLVAPHSVTIDHAGNIYVSDWASSFQVKIFSPDGKFLHAIGREGGRRWVGPWQSDGMLLPRGIAVTDAGQLWVAEDDGSPPRISVWNAASGAFLRDYIGPMPYGGGTYFWFDPHDPSLAHALGTTFRIDPAQKTCAPLDIDFRRRDADDPFTPNGHDLGPHPQVRILYRDGHEYAILNTGTAALSILQRQGDTYHAVAALGQLMPAAPDNDGTGKVVWDSDVGYRSYNGFFPDSFRGHQSASYNWCDSNDDGRVQPGEMSWVPSDPRKPEPGKPGRWSSIWGVDIAPDWTFFFAARCGGRLAIFRLDPQGWTPTGAPIYNIAQARPIAYEPTANNIDSLHVTNDGKLIVSYDFEGGHSPDAVAAYDFEGHRLWAVAMPRTQAGEALHANGAVYDFDVPGVGDVVCAWLYHGSFRPHLFTSDGLYIGTFFDDTLLAKFMHRAGFAIRNYVGTALDDARTGPDALWSESSKYFYQAPDGICYVVNGGNQQAYLFRIHGLDKGSCGRFEAACSVR